VFDIAYLRHVPGLTFMAPKDEAELAQMVATAMATPGPVAVRYPRGVGVGAEVPDDPELLPLGQGELLREGTDAVVLALGSRVYPALECAQELEAEHGLSVAVFNARFIKPLPEAQLLDLAKQFKRVLTAEEGCLAGGFGSAVMEFYADAGVLGGLDIRRVGVPDQFIEHGAAKELRAKAGVDKAGIKAAVLKLCGRGESV
jgi:1-deoxy-D-xylulose-5-phosphate synthase